MEAIGLSSVRRGVPVAAFRRLPGIPPVGLLRSSGDAAQWDAARHPYPHTHDFLVVVYFERGTGSLRVDDREWPVEGGDVFVVAPGEVVDGGEQSALAAADGWAVFFPADVIDASAPGAFLSWRAHPLLFPFARGVAGGAQRLRVPPEERPAFAERLVALERELRERRDGHHEAVLAHLTLLLVAVSRLAADVAGDLVTRDEPLLAAVFDAIEEGYGRQISLRDVAKAAGLTPGHLTTVVRRKTGRTVQQWLTERRMAEARRLLAETDLTVEAVGGRVGYRDAGYFARSFRRSHGLTPQQWRRAGRADSAQPLGYARSSR